MTVRSLPDARYFQIAALGALLTINFLLIDFGARPLPSAVAIASALLTQVVCMRLAGTELIRRHRPRVMVWPLLWRGVRWT